jgi:hypothetical protein
MLAIFAVREGAASVDKFVEILIGGMVKRLSRLHFCDWRQKAMRS